MLHLTSSELQARTRSRLRKAKSRLTSIDAWRIPKEPSTFAPEGTWSNKDQDPVPMGLQTWGALDYATYWISDLVNITSWQIAAAALVIGLSTVDGIVITLLSGLFNGLPTVLNGAPGTDHHIPFPIAIRASFGYYLSIFCVVLRALIAATWYGVNNYVGLFAMTEAIAALWPSYRTLDNHLPASAGITTQQMISLFLFSLIQIPLLIIPVQRLKKLFLWKALIIVPVSIGMVIWICVKAGDLDGIFNQPASVSGSTRMWLWLGTFTSMTNSWYTNTLNMSDYSRFSRSRRGPWSQLPTIPIVKTLYAILGIATVGAGRVLYKEDVWSPVGIIARWTGPGGRLLAFCCSVLWMFAQTSCNMSANSIPFGHDAMALFPHWMNVRRGSLFCMIIGSWAMVPWLLVNTASKFLTLMSALGSFVCPMCSIMIADYWIVRRCKLDVPALYNPHGRYRYMYGINWRALVVQGSLMILTIPGLVNSVSPELSIPAGYQHYFGLNWFINTFAGLFFYWGLCIISPPTESLVSETITGYLDGELSRGTQYTDSEHSGKQLSDDVKELN